MGCVSACCSLDAPKQARKREFVGRHWAQSLTFRKCAIPYYPCFGCLHRQEGTEVSKILANFSNSEVSKMALFLCSLAFWSVGVPWHSAYCAKSSRVFSCWSGATIISEVCGLFQLFTSAKKKPYKSSFLFHIISLLVKLLFKPRRQRWIFPL